MVGGEHIAMGLLEAAPDALLVADESGTIILMNGRAEKMFGWSRAELVGKPIEKLLPESLRTLHQQHRADYSKEPTVRPMGHGRPLQAISKDGMEILVEVGLSPLDVDGQRLIAVAVRKTSSYVLQLAAAEEQLGNSLKELEAVLEAIPTPVSIHADGHYSWLNSAAASVLGYQPEELTGRDVSETVHPHDQTAFASLLQHGTAAREIRFVAKDQSSIPLQVQPPISVSYRGRPSVLLAAHDTRELTRLQASLATSERLVTVGTLAAGVGHEINNPLGTLVMNLDMAVQELEAFPPRFASAELSEVRSMLVEATMATSRISRIVKALNIFARPTSHVHSEVDMRSVLDVSVKLALGELRHRFQLIRDFGAIPSVWVDESRFIQVFINLLMNATQAFEARPARSNTVHLRTFTDQSGNAVIEVQDNGPGMTQAVSAKIFEPFFTTKPVGQGTGLGLSIVHSIVTDAGGRISCDTKKGSGTTFRIQLPAYQGQSYSSDTPVRATNSGYRGRILVVDDDVSVTSAIARLLRTQHNVQVLTSSRQALNLLKRRQDFDLILCDIMMPELTGQDIYERLQAAGLDIINRFTFITGGAPNQLVQAFLESVPNSQLQKPFNAQTLRALVERKLAWRRQQLSA